MYRGKPPGTLRATRDPVAADQTSFSFQSIICGLTWVDPTTQMLLIPYSAMGSPSGAGPSNPPVRGCNASDG